MIVNIAASKLILIVAGSVFDNFEWKEGEAARFGLVHCNYETQERTIKKSGEFYSEMIKKRGVDKSMMEKYIEPCKYNVR